MKDWSFPAEFAFKAEGIAIPERKIYQALLASSYL
jgi:hypothetical protein